MVTMEWNANPNFLSQAVHYRQLAFRTSDEVFFANIVVVDANAGRVALLVSAFLNSVFRDLGDLSWNVRGCVW